MNSVHCVQTDQRRLLSRQWKTAQRRVEILPMAGVELSVLHQRPERLAWVPGSGANLLDQVDGRWLSLEYGDIAEKRDGVAMEDPVVLRADHGRDRGRRRP